MRRIILPIVACMVFGFANAQSTRFGVKGGLNVSNFTGYEQDVKSLIGFHVGGFAEIKVAKKFAVQPEFLYSTQGTTIEGFDGDSNTTVKVNYLNIPILGKYYITDAFSVEAGPQIGFLLSAKARGEDVSDLYKSTDFGFNLGCGYNFTEDISIGARYTIGLTDVNDISDGSQYPDLYNANFKNSNFALSLAYKF
ncbi:outer membrane protein with beta-barrel domain [Flavobacterium sp. 90]|uniref:porin family protein n=1 Tax=unclassified Flavobacterium TaxID=196869 RepID=UPI000EB48C41|nr:MULTISPECIES: porin family protein [unclassified Flavobacterium]RKR11158.1 outer membrane protein with beta-barrel domain [Flavobacterium sp. 81]TCK54939.1 outer membrane protein with beta-barrel domain [Flavobacterium sp. 90]